MKDCKVFGMFDVFFGDHCRLFFDVFLVVFELVVRDDVEGCEFGFLFERLFGDDRFELFLCFFEVVIVEVHDGDPIVLNKWVVFVILVL